MDYQTLLKERFYDRNIAISGSDLFLLQYRDTKNERSHFALIANAINVTYEGYLTLCVTSPTSNTVVEELHEMSLKDAWYSDRMVTIRKMYADGEIEGTVCHNCIYRKDAPVRSFNETLYRANLT